MLDVENLPLTSIFPFAMFGLRIRICVLTADTRHEFFRVVFEESPQSLSSASWDIFSVCFVKTRRTGERNTKKRRRKDEILQRKLFFKELKTLKRNAVGSTPAENKKAAAQCGDILKAEGEMLSAFALICSAHSLPSGARSRIRLILVYGLERHIFQDGYKFIGLHVRYSVAVDIESDYSVIVNISHPFFFPFD